MAIPPTSSLLNPPRPPMPPTRIFGCFFICTKDKGTVLFAYTDSRSVAEEMAIFIFGYDAVIEPVYSNVMSISNAHEYMGFFETKGIKQGYLSVMGEIIEFKTRVELIDEVLVEL